jgi:hypothetical protein
MDEPPHRTDAVAGRPRPRILDWTSDLDAGDREELSALRAAVGERDGELAALRRELAGTRRRLNDSCAALRVLERSRLWERPAVWREIRCRGLLDSFVGPE